MLNLALLNIMNLLRICDTDWTLYSQFMSSECLFLFYGFIFQCIFFIWCYLPIENNGSIILYRRLVRPMYLKYQNNIEDVTSKLTSQGSIIHSDLLSETHQVRYLPFHSNWIKQCNSFILCSSLSKIKLALWSSDKSTAWTYR